MVAMLTDGGIIIDDDKSCRYIYPIEGTVEQGDLFGTLGDGNPRSLSVRNANSRIPLKVD